MQKLTDARQPYADMHSRDGMPSYPARLRPAARLLSCAVVMLLAAPGAQACTAERLRNQTVVLASFDPAKTLLPMEYSMAAGDLLAVFVPRLASAKVLDAKGNPGEVVQPLDEKLYRELSAQGQGRVPAEVAAIQQKSRQWLYFGAARPGLAYVDLQDSKGRALLRVNVDAQTTPPRGEVLTLNETQQGKPRALTMFDSVELDLPGAPGDGWAASISGGTVTVRSITLASPAAASAPPRVRMRLDLQLKESEQVLEVKRGESTWRYTLQSRPLPAC